MGIGNLLYLCGSQNESYSLSSGSFLFVYDIIKSDFSICINSIYNHINPVLISYDNQSIIVIGGLNSNKCEIYNIVEKTWKPLPSLPNERYGCSALIDIRSEYLYIFGGISVKSNNERQNNYGACEESLEILEEIEKQRENQINWLEKNQPHIKNKSKKSFNSYISEDLTDKNDYIDYTSVYSEANDNNIDILTVFRLDLMGGNSNGWEKISINHEGNLLINRYFSNVIKVGDKIHMIGGYDRDGCYISDIIEYDMSSKNVKHISNLKRQMAFSLCFNSISIDNLKSFYMINDENNVISLNSFNFAYKSVDLLS